MSGRSHISLSQPRVTHTGAMKRKHDEILSTAALKVLVLGDGNLSYSLGLAERLTGAQVLATSYDDSQEVFTKYTESHATVARLEALGPRVRVLHGVDALDVQESLRQAQAQAQGVKKEKKGEFQEQLKGRDANDIAARDSESTKALMVFDHVVFNHPHTGWEDMHRHTALLAHFLESCKAVLAPPSLTEGQEGGQAHVTLAGDQCKRWKLFETAERLGYELRHICDFYRQFGPNPVPAQIKRHQSGKSFRLRGLPSFTYTFTLKSKKSSHPEVSYSPHFLPSSSISILWKHSYDAVEHEAAMTIKPAAGDGTTTGPLSKDAPITGVIKSVKCHACEKRFRGPKDLRKHMIDAHETGDDSEVSQQEQARRVLRGFSHTLRGPCSLADISLFSVFLLRKSISITDVHIHKSTKLCNQIQAEDLACEPCSRSFKDKTALEQHQRAKHSGKFQNLKPDWCTVEAAAITSNEKGDTKPVAVQPSLHFKGVDRTTYDARAIDKKQLQQQQQEQRKFVLCPVCDYYVTAPGSTAEHLADLRPPERPTYVCHGCDRTFREERALKQHANACWPFEEKMRGDTDSEEKETV